MGDGFMAALGSRTLSLHFRIHKKLSCCYPRGLRDPGAGVRSAAASKTTGSGFVWHISLLCVVFGQRSRAERYGFIVPVLLGDEWKGNGGFYRDAQEFYRGF